MTHHSVMMMSSLCIKNKKIDKFGDFTSDIDYNSRTYVLSDVIYLIINHCEPRRPKGASCGHNRVLIVRMYMVIILILFFYPTPMTIFCPFMVRNLRRKSPLSPRAHIIGAALR